MALIIDDVGERNGDDITLTLPTNVTLSFLPFSKHGRRLALQAWQQQRELMLHLPMATAGSKNPGPYAIHTQLDKWQVQYRVKKALADIPFVSGVNNHMGSAVTPDGERMGWVMEELAKRPLFFIDSLTISSSQAHQQAQAHGIHSAKRHVFLDPAPGIDVLQQQWQQALRIARKHGKVVVIGHPYPDTMAFLQQQLPQLAQQQDGVEVVPVAQLIGAPFAPTPLPKSNWL
ncbi:divergent polysaccharide deacetylase family protein [uncultured Ferrimonas sp.]|uniref:divergent polysaccharide deacetylase family protein n=1 Tax=uncultured Ferrimonas sp. TaxID=432640 RepID=UPI00262BAF72|nr:divergent polysaccharide deacetylase family protein [uncultured Ferrimonas sp.]